MFIESHLMYLNVFLNMTNMFSPQKIVYQDLSIAKKFKIPPVLPKNV